MTSPIRSLRTMKRGESYFIEERFGNGPWESVCECHSIQDAKEMLKTLKLLDKEEKREKKD